MVSQSQIVSGGCQRGAVRYRFEAEVLRPSPLCRCRRCQKAGANWGSP